MSRIHLLKILDLWLGTALVFLLPKPLLPPPCPLPPQSILLIRPGGIGDAVHLLPAIQALQKSFPEIAIDILAERRNAGVFAMCPGIRRNFQYDRPGQLLQALHGRYDVVIDTEQWHQLSAVVTRLVRAPVKIGFATNKRRRLFTHTISYCQDDYEIRSFLSLLEPLGVPADEVVAESWLHIPEDVCESVVSLLPQSNHQPIVAIFAGASIAEKRWGVDRFRSVAEWCLDRRLQVVLIGGEGDRPDAERIASGLEIVNLTGRTSLVQTAAIIEKVAMVVSGDSGVLHIAAGLGRPTVALFGPSSIDKWAPRGPQHVALSKCLSCSPCSRFGYTSSCPNSGWCMSDIAVTDVARAIATLLDLPDGRG